MKRLIYMLIWISLFFVSCTDDEYNFSESGKERLEEIFADCDKTLAASEYGWKMGYYPDSRRLGGYNFLFKFEKGWRVTMKSDFREDTQTTSYKYYGGQGAVLSFDSYNLLHILADPGFIPAGVGCRGDYELIIKKITPDTVYCVGRKWKQPMVLVKAQSGDWEGMEKIKANEKILVPVGENTPFFRNIKVGEQGIATFLYDFTNRFVEYFYNDDKGDTQSGRMAVIFSKEGFQLKEPIVVNGVTLKEFVYNEKMDGFTFGENGTLSIEHTPVVIFKDAWDSFYECVGGGLYQTSRDFLEVFNAAKAVVPDLVTIQCYWNISNLRFFSFILVDKDAEKQEPRWFHTVIGSVEKLEDGGVMFLPALMQGTNIIAAIADNPKNEKECEELFFDVNEKSASIKKILDIMYNPKGFTVISTADGNYYLISKEKSNYWMLFKPM